MPVPSRSVVLCALPRTGSSLLGQMLYASGAVGWSGEWPWREDVERNRAEWGVSSSRASSGSGARTSWRRRSRGRKAVQTAQWASFQPVRAEPAFDFEQIDGLYHVARVHDGAWARWFEAQGVEPLRVVYEELAADPAGVTEDVIARLGLEPSSVDGPAPMELARQADAVNLDWAARYRRLAGL